MSAIREVFIIRYALREGEGAVYHHVGKADDTVTELPLVDNYGNVVIDKAYVEMVVKNYFASAEYYSVGDIVEVFRGQKWQRAKLGKIVLSSDSRYLLHFRLWDEKRKRFRAPLIRVNEVFIQKGRTHSCRVIKLNPVLEDWFSEA